MSEALAELRAVGIPAREYYGTHRRTFPTIYLNFCAKQICATHDGEIADDSVWRAIHDWLAYAARLAAIGMTLHDDGTITSQRAVEPKKPRRPPPPSWTRAMFRRGSR